MTQDVLLYRLQQAENKIDDLEQKLAKVTTEVTERERRNLRWGISALGAIIIALGGVLWAYRGIIFK